jgi:hypothetical protein
MQLVALVDYNIFDDALKQASQIGRDQPLRPGLLHAPPDNDTKNWIERIWDIVEGALLKAYQEGMDAARPLVHKVSEHMTELYATAKERAGDIRAVVSERLNAFLRGVIEGALSRIQSTIKVENREIPMTGVTIEQKIKITGSLKASLEEICEFISEGEISLSAKYGSAD